MSKNKSIFNSNLIVIGMLIAVMFFTIPQLSFIYEDRNRLENNNLLDQKTISDIMYDLSLDYITQNKTGAIGFSSQDGMEMLVADDSWINSNYPYLEEDNISVFGLYSGSDNRIILNANNIYDRFLSQEGNVSVIELQVLRNKVTNTLYHELAHRLADDLSFQWINYYDMEVSIIDYDFDGIRLQNRNDFETLYLGPDFIANSGDEIFLEDLPQELHNSINFYRIYRNSSYPIYQFSEETFARLHAICWTENPDYQRYWELPELTEYSICQEYDYSRQNNRYQRAYYNIMSNVLEGYLNTYEKNITEELIYN